MDQAPQNYQQQQVYEYPSSVTSSYTDYESSSNVPESVSYVPYTANPSTNETDDNSAIPAATGDGFPPQETDIDFPASGANTDGDGEIGQAWNPHIVQEEGEGQKPAEGEQDVINGEQDVINGEQDVINGEQDVVNGEPEGSQTAQVEDKDLEQQTTEKSKGSQSQSKSNKSTTQQPSSKKHHDRHHHLRQRPSGKQGNNTYPLSMQQACQSPCQIGVIPMRSAAFQAPRIPLPKLCQNLLSEDEVQDDEDGVAFQFKPQTHCRTEVTFTIEPKPQPPWLTMLNCGFKPMVNCSAPPCYLSPNGNPGMDYIGGTQSIVNRTFGTEVQYSGMANFPTLQQIHNSFPGGRVIDAGKMQKRRGKKGGESSSESDTESSEDEEESDEEESESQAHHHHHHHRAPHHWYSHQSNQQTSHHGHHHARTPVHEQHKRKGTTSKLVESHDHRKSVVTTVTGKGKSVGRQSVHHHHRQGSIHPTHPHHHHHHPSSHQSSPSVAADSDNFSRSSDWHG